MGKAKKLAHLKAIRNVPLHQQMDDDRVAKKKDRPDRQPNDADDTEDTGGQNVRHIWISVNSL